MANRRMFSLQIVDTDAFIDMPQTSQLLYFHLAMRADDDGFVSNPRKIMKMIGIQDDDFKILVAKRFILTFETGVVVIKHWKIHNYIQNDRYKETTYLDEKKTLILKENGSYTECIQDVSKVDAQVRLGKDRLELGKDRLELGKDRLIIASSKNDGIKKIMDIFYKINPTLNWSNKTTRKSCDDLIKKYGLEETKKLAEYAISIQGEKYAPVITTPYQLWNKLSQLKIYYDKNIKNKIQSL